MPHRIADPRARAEAQLRISEERFRHIFENASVGIAEVALDGHFVTVNSTFCQITGYAREELLARTFQDITHPDDVAADEAEVARLVEGEQAHFAIEKRYIRKDGRLVYVHLSVSAVRGIDDEVSHFVSIAEDISERKAAEEALRRSEREEMRKKDEFIAVLAHELRNPLAPIRTSVSVLRELGSTDPILARCRDVIDRQVGHMARLIDDLLDVSRLSRGELRLQRSSVRLARVLDDAAELADALLQQQRQRLIVDGVSPDLVVDADAARLTQVVGNLLHNASKYSPPDTEVRLTVALDRDAVVIQVIDQGVGIPEAQLDRVFDLFAQTDNARSLSKGGLGIGLALARRLVEMHGGSIAAESAGPGRGSAFTVRLPRATAAGHASSVVSAAPAGRPDGVQAAMRILVADDNVDAAEMLGVLFEQAGCTVRRVHDGESAVLEAERFRPELAVLDIGMPGMDGYEACRRMRRAPWGAAIRIVALTGRGRESDRQMSLASGFDQHFVKPVDTDALLQLLQR